MKIVLWNVFEGFADNPNAQKNGYHPQRQRLMSQWIQKQKPNVVALLELSDFTTSQFQILATQWGHKHHHLSSGTFPMGISSEHTLNSPTPKVTDMTHGLISVEIANIHVVLCHIPPGKYAAHQQNEPDLKKQQQGRAKELRALLDIVLPKIKSNKKLIVIGDFNGGYHDDLVASLRAIGLVDPIGPGLLNNGEARLDYVFCSPNIESDISANVIQDPKMEQLSDHYPLMIEIASPKNKSIRK